MSNETTMPKADVQKVQQHFSDIATLSEAIDVAITEEDVFKLNQLLLKRGNAIEAVKKFSLTLLPEALKSGFINVITKVQSQEPEVQQALQQLSKKCKSQLSALSENRKAAAGYKLVSEKRHYTDSKA